MLAKPTKYYLEDGTAATTNMLLAATGMALKFSWMGWAHFQLGDFAAATATFDRGLEIAVGAHQRQAHGGPARRRPGIAQESRAGRAQVVA